MKTEKLSFLSFDGETINYLKLMPSNTDHKLPAILFEPGNRMTSDDYMWLLKPLAKCGWLVYAIYQRGYGSGVPDTNDRGGPIQQLDLQHALACLRSDVDADAERIAMVGHSNGGHMIQRLAAEEKVKCLVPISQVSDWGIFVAAAKEYLPDYYKVVTKEFGGSPAEHPEPYRVRSCLHLADKIKLPVLAIVGGDDTITPPHLTRLMHEALLAAGNTQSEMIIVPDVGHFFEVYAFNGYATDLVAKIIVDWLQKTI